ncbi:MAG: hypothetical protein ABIK89_07905 [Planctomycetota bacterium]
MDPATSLLAGHAAGKLIDHVAGQFRVHVIERWTKKRAQLFFEQFCQEVAAGTSERFEDYLSKIFENETCSEVLYDAYRSVCLTKSKTLGPRIIAVQTAELLLQNRQAEYVEQTIFEVAEQMTDEEIAECVEFIEQQRRHADNPEHKSVNYTKSGESIEIEWGKEQCDSNWHRETDLSLAPLDLVRDLGNWAAKAKATGMLSDDVKERKWEYPEDCERFDPEPGSVREVSWWLYLHPPCLQFVKIVNKIQTATENP